MAVTIRTNDHEATVNDLEWSSENSILLDV